MIIMLHLNTYNEYVWKYVNNFELIARDVYRKDLFYKN